MGPKVSSRKFRFAENERVLCYQGPFIYEAKCLQGQVRDGEKHFYLIHYSGWKKHWDEWVNESRVLKYNETNLNKQKELVKKVGSDKCKRLKVVKSVKNEKEVEKQKPLEPHAVACHSSSSLNVESELKRLPLKHVAEEQELWKPVKPMPYIVSVVIPEELKDMLVDDYDFVGRQKLLFHLPAKHSVQKILKKYFDEISPAARSPAAVRETVLGLQEYFNVLLGSQLLYKFERPQYGDMLVKYPDLCACQIYGAFHFLRFFVQISSILPYQNIVTEENMKIIVFYIHDCLRFLKDNKAKFFDVNEYETAPAEYHRRAIT